MKKISSLVLLALSLVALGTIASAGDDFREVALSGPDFSQLPS
jgi:hypothetical protein